MFCGYFWAVSVEKDGQKKPVTCDSKIGYGGEELEGMKGNSFLLVYLRNFAMNSIKERGIVHKISFLKLC